MTLKSIEYGLDFVVVEVLSDVVAAQIVGYLIGELARKDQESRANNQIQSHNNDQKG